MKPAQSELILNPDGSVYHLNLTPQDIAPVILLVGDPERVPKVSKYFDHIEVKKSKREFTTHTGCIGVHKFCVISTGIGTDNIDIVLNELDALVNIDLERRELNPKHQKLNFIRIGTSGSVQENIPVDSALFSDIGLGLDGLLQFYRSETVRELAMEEAFIQQTTWPSHFPLPYAVKASTTLHGILNSEKLIHGIMATLPGFYAPQGRSLRLKPHSDGSVLSLSNFEFEGLKITNLEMETAGIYGLSALLGHAAASLNCILANRVNGTFSTHPEKAVDQLIQYTLEKLYNNYSLLVTTS